MAVTDAFMQAVEKGEEYDLLSPRTGAAAGRLDARTVFDKIVKNAWATGEPGVFFIDRANYYNPVPQLGSYEATNPCVTADTWVQTAEGPRQVRDLVGGGFLARLDGVDHPSAPEGFFRTGREARRSGCGPKEGIQRASHRRSPRARARAPTRWRTETEWVPAGELRPGDLLVLSTTTVRAPGGPGRARGEEGYLLGLLLGDGHAEERRRGPRPSGRPAGRGERGGAAVGRRRRSWRRR